MELPKHTRLRFAKSKDPNVFQQWLEAVGSRVQIYSIVKDGKFWFVWYVPDDRLQDVPSINLDEV